MTTVDTTTPSFLGRLATLPSLILKHGNHATREDGMCAMEAAAWLAGLPHSDAPACACPVIARAVIRLNDRIGDDETRTELLVPLLAKVLNTRASRETMVKRGYVAADFAVRVFAPLALEKRGRLDLATVLRGVAPVVDQGTAIEARDKAREVRSAYAYAAYAAAYAADAAAAAAAADAAYAAAYAADAAAAAAADAADAAARKPIYLEGVRMIEAMIQIKDPSP